jgi:hypothetical protein
MRGNTIQYAIDVHSGRVVSQIGDEFAWPILDYEGMTPANHFQTNYHLEKVNIKELYHPGSGLHTLLHTRKLPLRIRNYHRAFWGMPPVKASPRYCPDCGEYFKKCKCNT